ncbi:hypothetical protein ACFXCZ_27355 [Streptomyces sp. NPDC059396]|uniref:hypothetical protein n=1 Tax=Streptomyces sp. NPDC059396 TaxID=3346819 RepID=UPI00367981F2
MSVDLLAAKTKKIDPSGDGLSPSYVGFIVGAGRTARETCSDRAGQLVAAALGREVGDFFEDDVSTPEKSPSPRRTETPRRKAPPLPDQLMDQPELARFLRKSMSWIDGEIQKSKEEGRIWPGLFYVGKSRRFDPAAVLEGQRRQRASA